MPRYFIEVSYKGTNYSGFQIQQNANSIQAEVTRALRIFFHQEFELTGASRTDAGVHALQNFFHLDFRDKVIVKKEEDILSFSDNIPLEEVSHFASIIDPDVVYHLNAILPGDIVIKKIFPVNEHSHCRFDAVDREYRYFIYQQKDPFLRDRAYFYPFKIDLEHLQCAAKMLLSFEEFDSFSKKKSQTKNSRCVIKKSEWIAENNLLLYCVVANRFLRGMVKGLVGTMIQVATGKITMGQFEVIIKSKDGCKANFSVPGHALFLSAVNYPDSIIHVL
jgi:tRNA pseudouridine38-40 synthase